MKYLLSSIFFYFILVPLSICTENYIDILKSNYQKAAKDNYTYPYPYNDPITRAKYYYSNTPLNKYKVLFPNETYFLIRIYVNPCKNFEEKCCQGKATCEEDNPEIVAGNDLELAWIVNNFLPICENEFNNNECGTFLEIHLPGNERVLVEQQIHVYYVNGFQSSYLKTTSLCAGSYEVKLNLIIYMVCE